MKFFVNNDLKKEHPLAIMITALVILLALFTLSDLWVKGSLFGYSVSAIHLTLIGDAENFVDPFSFSTLLEMIHSDLFFSSLLFLVIAALSLRLTQDSNLSKILLLLLLVLLITAMITPFIALNGSYLSTYLWFYSFIVSHALFLVIMIDILWHLWFDQ